MKVIAEKRTIKHLANNAEMSRMDWLDALRALAMLLVMYGHLYRRYEFFLFANPVKIPLFFAISGYLLYGREKNTKKFFQRILLRVALPSLILSVGFGLRFILTQGFDFYVNYVVEVLIGKRIWYIVCCIIAQILFYYLQKLLGSGWKLGVAVFAITAIGLLIRPLVVNELFQFNTALICQFYLLIGYWLKKYQDKLQNVKLWLGFGLLGVYIALAIGSMFLFPGRSMDVHQDKYSNIPYCFVMVTIGCIALFVCAQRIKRFPRWLCFIGQNTLIFYIHANFWTGMINRVAALLKLSVPGTWYWALVWLTLTCIGCGIEALILNKFLPEANGKTRKKKTAQASA